MKRHLAFRPLSQDHHHTLSLCLRILRQPERDYGDEWLAHFADLEQHFCTEERQFAPLWSILNRPDLHNRFQREHAQLRQLFHETHFDDADWNIALANQLRDHIRFEERELFPELERCIES